jgi:hypothetical protein
MARLRIFKNLTNVAILQQLEAVTNGLFRAVDVSPRRWRRSGMSFIARETIGED